MASGRKIQALGAFVWVAVSAAAAQGAADPLPSTFTWRAPQRRATFALGAAEVAAKVGPALFDVDSRVHVAAQGRVHQQVDRAKLEWDDQGGLRMTHTAGKAALELWRVGGALFVRHGSGPLRQKHARDMDAGALFDRAHGTFAQALATFAPLAYLEPAPAQHAGRRACRYRLEVAPSGQTAAAPAAGGLQPSVWRQALEEREVEGFVVVDVATGVVLAGELNGRATWTHAGAPPATLRANVRCALRPRERAEALAPPAAVGEFRRAPRPRDPIAFYRAAEREAHQPAAPGPGRRAEGDQDGDDDGP